LFSCQFQYNKSGKLHVIKTLYFGFLVLGWDEPSTCIELMLMARAVAAADIKHYL